MLIPKASSLKSKVVPVHHRIHAGSSHQKTGGTAAGNNMATQEIAIRRLRQTQNHLKHSSSQRKTKQLAIVHGPSEPALVDWTLADLLDEQCTIAGDKQCLIVPFSETDWTFSQLRDRARNLAKGLLALGVKRGDRIGILAGNCEEYVTVFYASGYLGAILVVLNSTYTAAEARYALKHSGKSFGEIGESSDKSQAAKYYC